MAETEIPVIMRFLAETQDLQDGTEDVKDATGEALDDLQNLADQAGQIAEQAINQVSTAYQSLKQEVQSIAGAAAAASLATAVSITAFGSSAVGAAKNFQDLRARLQGITGDAEEAASVFQDAVDFAARTPFSVESIVAATTTLESFGQGGAESLELVANIAAATGGRLEDVSLRVAKALQGTSEGFTGLRDTAGITGERLARFGANLSSAGLVSLKTKEDIEAARSALLELGRTEFAGSIERQADTLSGAVSNAQDAITNFLAVIGASAVPTLTSLARSFATGVNAATELIKPISPLITLMGAFTAAAAGAVGVVAGFAIPFAGVIAKALLAQRAFGLAKAAVAAFGGSAALLEAVGVKIVSLAAGLGSTTIQARVFNSVGSTFAGTVAPRVAAGFGLINAATSALLASPITPFFLAATVAAGVGTLAINRYAEAQKELGEAIDRSAGKLAASATAFREYSSLIERISGTNLSFDLDVARNADELAQALKGVAEVDLAAAVEKSGKSLQDLERDLANANKSLGSFRVDLVSLKEAQSAARGDFVRLSDLSEREADVLRSKFGDVYSVSLAQVNQAAKEANFEFRRMIQVRDIIETLIGSLGKIPEALKEATEQAEGLNQFLSFAGRLDDVGQLNGALSETNGKLREIEANLLTAVGTLDRFELTKALGDPKISEGQEKAIKTYLALLDSRSSLEKKIASEVESAKKKEIAAYELATERKKVAGELTLEQERERIQKQIKLVEKGSTDEVALLRKVAQLDEQIRRERITKTQELVQKQLKAVNDSLDEVVSRPGSTSFDVGKELKDSIQALETFEKANKQAFQGAPEVAERFRERLVDLKRELRTVEAEQLVDQFDSFKTGLEGALKNQGTTAQQIANTSTAIAAIQSAIAAGTIDRAEGLRYVAELEDRVLNLNKKQTDEKLKQANEIAQLEQRALEEEINILELRKQAGENVDRELGESRQRLMQSKLDAIEQEKQAAIAAGADVAQAEKKAQLQREALFRSESTRRFQETQRNQTNFGQLKNVAQRSLGPSAGGGNRAGTSQPAGISFAPSASFSGVQAAILPNFAENFGVARFRRPDVPKAPKFAEVDRKVRQEAESRQTADRKKYDTVPNNVINQKASFYINGDDPDMVKREIQKQSRKLLQRERQNGLTASKTTRSPIDQSRREK